MRLVSIIVLSFILSFCVFQNSAFSQEKKIMLSFEEALKISLENNPRFKQDRLLEQEKKQEKKAASGLYLPTIGLSTAVQRKDGERSLTIRPNALSLSSTQLPRWGFPDIS